MTNDQAENTDRELWREREGDFYANSIHVTEQGGIGINVGGRVIVMPLEKWYAAADELDRLRAASNEFAQRLFEVKAMLSRGLLAGEIRDHIERCKALREWKSGDNTRGEGVDYITDENGNRGWIIP